MLAYIDFATLSFVIVFLAIIALILIIAISKSKKKKVQTGETYMMDFESSLSRVLDVILAFKDAYLINGDRMDVFVSLYGDIYEGGTRHGKIKIVLHLLDWWEHIIPYEHRDVYAAIASNFVFDEYEKTFTYTGISTYLGNPITYDPCKDKISKKLHKFLDKYERAHPGVRFERKEWGGMVTFKKK